MLKIINTSFNKRYKLTLVVLIFLCLILLPLTIYNVLLAPEDYLQGVYARIMYIHVPAAWLALFWYSILTLFSASFLISKNVVFDFYAESIAPIGAVFCLITLLTGSIWGKPTWGAWWVWDARLTSMLILFFIYLAYISLRRSLPRDEKVSHIAAIFVIVGFINIPIIKFSVDLWNTLHQPASFIKLTGPSIHIEMLKPLLLSALNLGLFSVTILLIKLRI
jgi:heme exporter protein C